MSLCNICTMSKIYVVIHSTKNKIQGDICTIQPHHHLLTQRLRFYGYIALLGTELDARKKQ